MSHAFRVNFSWSPLSRSWSWSMEMLHSVSWSTATYGPERVYAIYNLGWRRGSVFSGWNLSGATAWGML